MVGHIQHYFSCTCSRSPRVQISYRYSYSMLHSIFIDKTKLHGLSQRASYTDRATAACRRSDCQLLRIEGATWSA
jgi:hypothetical protein